MPEAPGVTRCSENEPLGPCVVTIVEATSEPLRRRVTFHGTPLRFWSTSNSTSTPRSSRLSFSLAVELWVQAPLYLDSVAALRRGDWSGDERGGARGKRDAEGDDAGVEHAAPPVLTPGASPFTGRARNATLVPVTLGATGERR